MVRTPVTTTRRAVLSRTGAAALLGAAQQLLPRGAHAETPGPETTRAVLGFVALVDAAPLIVAKELGLFAKHGMPGVEVVKAPSWNEIRRGLSIGGESAGYDGAHVMTPLSYLIHTGNAGGAAPVPMHILARLNTNGQAISLTKGLLASGAKLQAAPLKPLLAARKGSTAAMTFRGGTHDLWLRYWLAAGGIEPETDVSVVAVPPPEMVSSTQVGIIDAFCAGEPWNALLVNRGAGFTACVTGEIWADHPEKAFTMRAEWVSRYPRAATALTAAVIEAQVWSDTPANRPALAAMLGKPNWLGVVPADMIPRLEGEFSYGDGRTAHDFKQPMKFWADHASYPFQSHDLWFLTEGIRWGTYLPDLDTKALVAAVNREDIWRAAARLAGAPGGVNAEPKSVSRGIETFFDGKKFDPANPGAYLDSQPIKQLVS